MEGRKNIEKYLIKNNNTKYRTWKFKSITDLLDIVSIPYVDTADYSKAFYYMLNPNGSEVTNCYSNAKKPRGFNLTDNIEEAIKIMMEGWENGTLEIKDKVNKIKTKVGNRKTVKTKYDVVGYNASVPRYLQGIPTNMINNKMVMKKDKVLNIYKSMGYTGSYPTNIILEEAAKSIAIIDILEKAGYRCNVFVTKCNRENITNQIFSFVMKVKDAKEKFNIKKSSFLLSHPDFQRRILWRLFELHPDFYKPLSGYGRPFDADIMDKNYINIDNDILISKETKLEYSKIIDIKENDIFIPITIKGDVYDFVENILKEMK